MIRKIGLCALAAGSLAFAGCGDDEDKDKGGSKAQSLSLSVNAQNKLTGLKDLEGGVVKLTFRNSAKAPRDLQLIRVEGNHSPAEIRKVIDSEGPVPIPAWLHGAGGLGTVAPGQTGTATQVLPAGNYYAVSMVDNEGGQGPPPLFQKFQIKGGSDSGTLPNAPATINATEYDFDAQGLKPGKNTLKFTNNGKELHHVVAAPIAPGKTLNDVRAFFRNPNPKGQPPLDFRNAVNTAVLDGGTQQVTDLQFAKPGKYALLCFITDRKGGPEHVRKGMIAEADVR